MAEQQFDEDGNPIGVEGERTPAEWAQYRKSEKARKDAEKEANDAKRELAFLKAGIPMDDPKVGYFVKGYDGELTPEAIRAQATADGFIAAPAPTPEEAAAAAQAAAQQQQALSAQDRQTLLAQGGLQVGEIPAEVMLEQAYEKGGDKAMMEQAAALGIKIVES